MIIADIENAIINRITEAQNDGTLGYQLKKVATYGGEFSDGIDAQVRNFPAVLVIFSGATLITKTKARAKFEAKFALICCAQNLRSEKAARQGDDNKPGSYKIVLDMIGLVAMQNFGLEIDPLVPEGIEALLNDRSNSQLASIYGINMTTSFEIELGSYPSQLDDFATFHSNWDLPPHITPTPTLPADPAADATDHIELETAP